MRPRTKRCFRLCLLGLLLLPAAAPVAAQPEGKPAIWGCDKPFMFGFGSWEEAKTAFSAKPDGIHISVKNAQEARAWPA